MKRKAWFKNVSDEFHTSKRDCVVRAISIATEQTYADVLDRLEYYTEDIYGVPPNIGRRGVFPDVYKRYLKDIGWRWIPTMRIGTGCRVHLCHSEMPKGRLIVRVSRHLVAVVDGVINDTYDCSRNGTRCVYGYWCK